MAGEGTTIEMILPATEADAAVETLPGDGGDNWLSNKRMMLIDDDEAVRVVLTEQFRDAGGMVDDFSSGREALEAVAGGTDIYDYVLSDFAMPGLDGIETLRQVKKLAPAARFALMTGYADELKLAGNEDIPVVRKPVDIVKLRAALELG